MSKHRTLPLDCFRAYAHKVEELTTHAHELGQTPGIVPVSLVAARL
jgi:hypothetical protein